MTYLRTKPLGGVLLVLLIIVLWFVQRPLIIICQDRSPVLVYGKWWDGACTYHTGPGISSDAVQAQIVACYCEWWLERHPESWQDCKYPQTPARWIHGTDSMCRLLS